MPILSSEIKFYLSGGGANQDVNASLGGVISSYEVTTAQLHNLFDAVSATEASAGRTEYRCIYVKNTNNTLTLNNAVAWIGSNTPSPSTAAEIGVGTAAISGTEPTIGNETSAPVGVVFSSPATLGSGLALGSLTPGATRAIWIRRIVSAAAAAYNSDGMTLSVSGDTAA